MTMPEFTERCSLYISKQQADYLDSQTVPEVKFNRSNVIRNLLEICRRKGISVKPLTSEL